MKSTRVGESHSSILQSSLRKKMMANLESKRSLESAFKRQNSRLQPSSILPLNMLVSDIAYRDGTIKYHSNESPRNAVDEFCSQLLKIQNRKKRPKFSNYDKYIKMFQERHSKLYPLHTINAEHRRNNEEGKPFKVPTRIFSENQENLTPNVTSNLSTPLRQQCNSFTQLYGRKYNQSEKQIGNKEQLMECYSDQGNSYTQNINGSLTNKNVLNQEKEPSNMLTTPLRQRNDLNCFYDRHVESNDFLSDGQSLICHNDQNNFCDDFVNPKDPCFTSTPFYEHEPLLTYRSSDNSQISPRRFLMSPETVCSSVFVSGGKNVNTDQEKFVFNPVIDSSVSSKSFDEILNYLEESVKGSVISESSCDSSGSIMREQSSPMDSTMVRTTTVEEMLTFTLIC